MKNALKQAAVLVAMFTLVAGLSAQDKKSDDTRNVAGTWDVNLMSHQMALVLEHDAKDATKVTGTLMVMGKDVEVNGDFVDGKLTLIGKGALMGPRGGDGHGDQAAPPATPLKLTATLKDDGTLEGEMPMPQGAAKWTAERLKKKSQ
ncbi:MAG: hypothetical protein ABI665_07685 [Vicinamibacterales bacterium]